jgi:hypothetical protein
VFFAPIFLGFTINAGDPKRWLTMSGLSLFLSSMLESESSLRLSEEVLQNALKMNSFEEFTPIPA